MTQDLMQRLMAVQAASASGKVPTWEELLAQLGDTDPRAQLIGQYLAAQRQAEEDLAADGDADDSEAIEHSARISEAEWEQRERRKDRLRRMVRNMREELEELRERNDRLAAALGACYLCWGDDPECPLCHGNGHPGFLAPEPDSFSRLVAPALRRIRRPAREDRRPPKSN